MDSVIGLAEDRLARGSVSPVTPLAAASMYVASFAGRFSSPSSFILHRIIPISLLFNSGSSITNLRAPATARQTGPVPPPTSTSTPNQHQHQRFSIDRPIDRATTFFFSLSPAKVTNYIHRRLITHYKFNTFDQVNFSELFYIDQISSTNIFIIFSEKFNFRFFRL